MPNSSEIVCQGWLTKSPPAKGIFRPRWRKRWFVLKTGSFPHQFVLEYYTDDSARRLKGGINLDECEQLIGPLSVQERHKHTFQIHTPGRTYFLAADSESEMSKWVSSLCHVCSLKSVDEETEGGIVYSRAGDENKPRKPEANGVVQNREATESDDSSPTLSNKLPSGPYIPISECFTGKPMPKSDSANVTYSNSSVFQFPPKVNWATHPSKREHTDSDATPTPTSGDAKLASGSPVTAPPRPPKPKNNGSPISVTVTSPPPTSSTEQLKSPTPFEHEETLDSSSTCSSIHSPPSSAGALYCNIADLGESRSGAVRGSLLSSSSVNTNSPTSPVTESLAAPPPVVDRNLKPLRKEGIETEVKTFTTNASPTQKLPPSYASGTMTLPSRGGQYNGRQHHGFFAGPVIDRSRKPPDGHLSLGPTPAQMKSHGRQSCSTQYNQRTLPSSPHRRAGPVVSPNEKRPIVYHEYEQANEMKGTYLQIECQINKDTESSKFPTNTKIGGVRKGISSLHPVDSSGSVEYRLIDPVKTRALNKTMEDREKQLRNNTLSKNHH